ncbi:MAG TPA: choice-of-anchor tandem repeat GloVer-containing protein, partial [Candidatus Baltobacteraceae bacterium]|nr:choice-of-anchor tandem repeat GloVer-containing protein [Candidatus Baltobacteraceae bacterium]
MRLHSIVLRWLFATSAAAALTACGGHAMVPQSNSGSKTADAALQQPAAAETLLHSFGGPDGAGPSSGVVADGKGDFFGTTIFGGKGNGTIFELKPKGDGTYFESVLYSFTGGADGSRPLAGVAMDASGALYTNTLVGGNGGCPNGCGTVVKLTPGPKGYTETTIYGFLPGTDADQPVGTPVVDTAGAVYGATQFGGTSNNGAVYKLTPQKDGSYKESVIYSLPGNAGGSLPQSGVAIDSSGNLFGETQYGGVSSPRCLGGCGVIFKLKVAGKSYTPQTIFQFHGDDGDGPMTAVTVDRTTGIVYGTTPYGGSDARG